ncbi:MAG: protein kinase [Deltaproteobacteria bacterium]|nr:protein kinase [Deltaproteobacteria bacterium]
MFAPDEAIDIWIVQRALGQGGMGSVYRCHNRDARRILAAIKVLDYGLKRNQKARARFVREAEILCALDHPNIVKARNVRLDVDPPYIEMEFVEGTSLEHRISEGRLDARWVLGALKQLAGALEYMHGRGVRHRDIKPSNVLARDDGSVVLVDFGIATEEDGSTLTDQGSAMGSVAYVPPEWVMLSRPDPVMWDLYALGVVAYEALSGQAAFETPSGVMNAQRFHQVLQAKQNHPPLDPGGELPVGLRAVVRDLTRSRPEDRLSSAAELSRRLGLVDFAHVDPAFRFFDAGPAERTIVPESELGDGSLSPDPAESPVPARPRRGFAGWAWVSPVVVFTAALTLWVVMRPGSAPEPDKGLAPAGDAPVSEPAAVEATPAPAEARSEPPAPEPVANPSEPSVSAPVVAASKGAVPRPSATLPSPGEASAVAPAVSVAPAAAISVSASSSGPPVTHAQLATWLAGHPEWQQEAAVADGRADEKYLRGWSGATPPAGREGSPAVGVTWGLAKAYCAGRGGLAVIGAEPLTWSGAELPWLEYRSDAGAPAWRRDDGAVSDRVDPNQSNVSIGFRCAR